MELSIVIVSFNTKRLLGECLKSLIVGGQWLMANGEVIVVDNASTDGTVEMLEARYKDIKILRNEKNLGFAKAVNQGVMKAKGDFIFLLNPDTRVRPESPEKLIEFAQGHPEVGVVGARLVNSDGSVQPSVYHHPTILRAIKEYWLEKKGTYEKYTPKEKNPVEVEAVTGAAMLIPRRTIKKVGLLDERYFMYFEDLDYCRRVRKAGLKIYYFPEAEIIHHHGKSAQKAGAEAYRYLSQSSKVYNGLVKYNLLYLIIWIGQKWQKIVGKR